MFDTVFIINCINYTILGGGVSCVMFDIDMSRPACANDINFNATKNPDFVKKPLAVGSDKSQI